MDILKRYKEIPREEWSEHSQKMELEIWNNNKFLGRATDDRNSWWMNLFEGYKSIEDEKISSILEVGCGPFAKNIQYIMGVLKHKPTQIHINDPLLTEYIKLKKPVTEFIQNFNVVQHTGPLEELKIDPVDMIISINVLDHVFNMDLCLKAIYNNLNTGGIIILGNDLTDDNNFNLTPKNDPYGMLHPIRFDHNDIKPYTDKYEKIFEKISEVNKNNAHYGTLLFIGRKE